MIEVGNDDQISKVVRIILINSYIYWNWNTYLIADAPVASFEWLLASGEGHQGNADCPNITLILYDVSYYENVCKMYIKC